MPTFPAGKLLHATVSPCPGNRTEAQSGSVPPSWEMSVQIHNGQQITDHKTMKIAFVNQRIDTILPPYQNSVGACTYGVACCLANSCEVIVYGCDDSGSPTDLVERGVHFRFFPSSVKDRVWHNIRRLLSPSTPYPPLHGRIRHSAAKSQLISKSNTAISFTSSTARNMCP